jgi:AraC-like DNA-binding protein
MLLASLLIAFAIRIFKSMVYFFAEGHEVPDVVMNFGFGANLAIFPLLLLYLRSFFDHQYRFDWRKHSFHFVPSFVVVVLSGIIPSYFWMQQNGYAISLWSAALYLPFCIYTIYKNVKNINGPQRVWVIGITLGVTLVWTGYLANFIFGLVSYITAPVSFSFVIYFLTFVALRKSDIFVQKERYQNSAYSDHQIDKCFEEWQALVEASKPYRDASLTLPKAAEFLQVAPNLLSETINKRMKLTFPDYINSLRIRDARLLLKDPAYQNKKIAVIAYETGFNSLSVFNAAFRRHTDTTPSAYRKGSL